MAIEQMDPQTAAQMLKGGRGRAPMDDREQLAWLGFGLAGVAAVVFCFLWVNKKPGTIEKVVTKTVEVPKDREVIRTVEVPKIKEVVVEKVVEKEVVRELTKAQMFVGAMRGAPLLKDKQKLTACGPVRVGVFVSDVLKDAVQSDARLTQKAELRLRSLGVPVTDEESANTLAIEFTALKDRNAFMYSTHCNFTSVAMRGFAGEPAIMSVVLWSDGGVGIAGTEVVKNAIDGAVEKWADSFANAYLAANPKN